MTDLALGLVDCPEPATSANAQAGNVIHPQVQQTNSPRLNGGASRKSDVLRHG